MQLSPRAKLCFVKGPGQRNNLQLSPSTALLCQRPRTDRQCTAVSEHRTALSKAEDRHSVCSCLRAQHCFVKGRRQTHSLQLSPSTALLFQRPRTDRHTVYSCLRAALLCQIPRTDIESTAVSEHSTALSKAEERQTVYSCLRAQQCSAKAEDRQTDSVQLSPSTALLCQGLRTFGNTS